jgi:hypothetical protein
MDDRNIVLGSRQENHTARMSHQDCRPRMVIVGKELFDDHDIWSKLLHHFYYTIVQATNTNCHVGSRTTLSGTNDTSLTNVRSAGTRFKDGIAGDAQTRIYAENTAWSGMSSGHRGNGGISTHAPQSIA